MKDKRPIRYIHGVKVDTNDGRCAVIANYKDPVTHNSELKIEYDPVRPVWITRPEYRTFDNTKEMSQEHELEMFLIPESEMTSCVAKALGRREGARPLKMGDLCKSPYVHGADIDVRAVLKRQSIIACPTEPTHYTFGFLDIETSVLGGNEIIAISYMDGKSHTVYTAALSSFFKDDEVNQVDAVFYQESAKYRSLLLNKATGKTPSPRDVYDNRKYIFKFKAFEDESEMIRAIFARIHNDRPDFIGIWNLSFDIPKLRQRIMELGLDENEIFCHPDVPTQLRSVNYISNDRNAGHITDAWPWLSAPGYSQFIDAMCLYSRLRIVKGRDVSYALDYIATKHLGAGKLKFGAGHYVMQTTKMAEYCVYNAFDVIEMDLLEQINGDIRQMVALSGMALLDSFHHQTVRTKYNFYNYCRSRKMVPGSVGWGGMKVEGDDMIVNVGGNVLSPRLYRGEGASILKDTDLATRLHLYVMDSDATSMYPTILMQYNVSRDTKTDTVLAIENMTNQDIEDFFENVTDPKANAIYLGEKFFNLPSYVELLNLWDNRDNILLEPVTIKTYDGYITKLEDNEIFVFGSNTEGRHGKGAALIARTKFEAELGVSRGITGRCYAIVTKDLRKPDGSPSIPRDDIVSQITELYNYANDHQDQLFYIAYKADARPLNNYSIYEIAEMFSDAGDPPENIVFETAFRKMVDGDVPRVYNVRDNNIPSDAVLIDRTTEWGNPYRIGKDGDREEVIHKYEMSIKNNQHLKDKIKSKLKGRSVVCHCAPKACHGDVLLKVANE